MKQFWMVAFFAAVAVSAAPAAAEVGGKWTVHQSIAGNESESVCVFEQAGANLKGSCDGQAGKIEITGKVEEAKVNWSFKTEYNGTPLTVVYTGTLASGKISGSVSVPEFNADGDFVATPVK